MKKLYIIGGTMGVGKTTVCQKLKLLLPNSVFLDGDLCWDAHPFQVTEETKKMVVQNICFLLNQFIKCSAYENIFFCWVMHEQSIIDSILDGIDQYDRDIDIKIISLMCSADTLKERLEKKERVKRDVQNGVRTCDTIKRSIERLPLYDKLRTVKIYTDDKSIDCIAENIECI